MKIALELLRSEPGVLIFLIQTKLKDLYLFGFHGKNERNNAKSASFGNLFGAFVYGFQMLICYKFVIFEIFRALAQGAYRKPGEKNYITF